MMGDSININKEMFIEKLKLSENIINTESELYKMQVNSEIKILKRFSHRDLDNKIKTMSALIDNKDCFDEKFIIPETIALYDDEIIGYIMRYVDNYNLSDILNSNEFSISFKKDLLKQIGNILLYTDKIRKQNKELSNFYIGDLHTNNFMYDKERKILTVCDLDSCKVSRKFNFSSLYLKTAPNILFMTDKYPLDYNSENVINSNTDIFCYIILILNFLYGGNVQHLGKNDYEKYLEYLKSNGLSLELIDIFARIYDDCDNINPVYFIDRIPNDISKLNKRYFKI